MTPAAWADILGVPPTARVDLRVAKDLVEERSNAGPADRRLIRTSLRSLTWAAALKPAHAGLPAHRSPDRTVVEIAVLAASIRTDGDAARLARLLHRSVAYPVALATTNDDGSTVLSFAEKRASATDPAGSVVERLIETPPFRADQPSPSASEFLRSLRIGAQPCGDLADLYDCWIASVEALLAAAITGAFRVSGKPATRAERREALDVCARLGQERTALLAAAAREKQLNRRVELNVSLARIEAELARRKSAL